MSGDAPPPVALPVFELMVCVNRRYGDRPSCAGRGSQAIADALARALVEQSLPVKVIRSPCQSACERGPAVRFLPGPVFFFGMSLDTVPAVVGQVAERVAAASAG